MPRIDAVLRKKNKPLKTEEAAWQAHGKSWCLQLSACSSHPRLLLKVGLTLQDTGAHAASIAG